MQSHEAVRRGARVLVAALVLGLAGCSTQAWYEGVQRSPALQCGTLPPGAARQDCEARSKPVPYEQYEKDKARAPGAN
jgi:hypothetical protein